MAEEDYVGKWATILSSLTFLVVLGYFGYLEHNGLVKSLMDYIVLIGLPMGILPLVAYFLSSEILGCRKFHRPREICLKRFAGRLLLCLGLMSIAYLVLVSAVLAGLLNPGRPSTFLILVPMTILVGWSALAFLVVTKFREAVRKLTEGLW
jgi:hypothetical protein